MFVEGFITAKNELSFVGIAVFIDGVQFMLETEQSAAQTKVKGAPKLIWIEIFQFLGHIGWR